jgi:hypothetical protein
MKYLIKILGLSLIIIPSLIFSQPLKFPYAGGEEQFLKDVKTSLMVEATDSGRVYFVEINYLKNEKKIGYVIHGVISNDATTMLIRAFFKDSQNKWNKRKVQKTPIVIPLFISPTNIENPQLITMTNIIPYAKLISKTLGSKICFLHTPIYIFREETQIDIEPIY